MLLATVAMLFAAFASAYIVRRSGTDWVHIALPGALWVNTLVLCSSSLALELSFWSGSRHRWRVALWSLSVAILLGGGFLVGQLRVWQELQSAGVYLPTSPHSSFVYLLTGAHGAHVVAALALLGYAAYTSVIVEPSTIASTRRWVRAMSQARTAWHFLLGIWLGILWLLH